MKLGILQTGHVPEDLVPEHGEYPAMFERLLEGRGFGFRTYSVVDGEFPARADVMEGWLVTGSRHGAYDGLPWISKLEEFIRAAHDARIPLAGICFGHQILAQALGGRVEKFSGGWGVGHMRYVLDSGVEIGLNAMHQDQVVEAPSGAETVLSSDFCRYAGLAYGDTALGIQAHPEFSKAYTADLIASRRGKLLAVEIADAALAGLSRSDDWLLIADMLSDFFWEHGKRAADLNIQAVTD